MWSRPIPSGDGVVTWTRLDDRWTERPVFEQLGPDASWHLLCMIQHCSRNALYNGVMTLKTALRASLVDDPETALALLLGAGLVEQLPDGTVKVVEIDEHIPPPSVRDATEATKIRTRRWRKHKNGDHSDCLAENCPHASRDEPGDASPQEQAQDREGLPPEFLIKVSSKFRPKRSCTGQSMTTTRGYPTIPISPPPIHPGSGSRAGTTTDGTEGDPEV
jgi:hypothetical protein